MHRYSMLVDRPILITASAVTHLRQEELDNQLIQHGAHVGALPPFELGHTPVGRQQGSAEGQFEACLIQQH